MSKGTVGSFRGPTFFLGGGGGGAGPVTPPRSASETDTQIPDVQLV